MNNEEMIDILYPRRFHTREEIEKYVGGDKITCLICGKSYIRLSKHIASGHGCDPKVYKDALNIPRCTPLFSLEDRLRVSENSKETFYKKLSNEQRDFLLNTTHNKCGNGGAVKSTIAKNAKIDGARKKGKNRGKKHGRTHGKCHGCGKCIEISTLRVNRVTKCPDCLEIARKNSVKNWNEKNKQKMKEYRAKWYRERTEKNNG